MPYDIRQGYGDCSGYAVVGPDGTVRGCHATRQRAEAQRAALYSVEDEQAMGKSVRVGGMVSWNSSGGRAEGKIKRIIRNGSYNVPDSDFTITGTEDNPAVVIEVYRDGKPTGRMVGHRMNSLTAKKFWDSFDPNIGVNKSEVSLFAKRDYSTESRRRMAESGQAMPDGSFPIANRADLRNAIQSVGRASNYAAARRHIISRARVLGAMEMLPEDWK